LEDQPVAVAHLKTENEVQNFDEVLSAPDKSLNLLAQYDMIQILNFQNNTLRSSITKVSRHGFHIRFDTQSAFESRRSLERRLGFHHRHGHRRIGRI
jgi:hypothetical protein